VIVTNWRLIISRQRCANDACGEGDGAVGDATIAVSNVEGGSLRDIRTRIIVGVQINKWQGIVVYTSRRNVGKPLRALKSLVSVGLNAELAITF